MEISAQARQMLPQIISFRRALHAHPELAFAEHETQAYICKQLERLGIAYRRQGTGVIAAIEGRQAHPCVGLRADMDGLPVTEDTGLPFASVCPGKMHACGHDAHVAMLLGAAELLCARQELLRGPVRLFFQPAEETMSGAETLVELPEAKSLDTVFALHIWSGLEAGKVSLEAGARMAAADAFTITIKGSGAHCGTPQEGRDAILASAFVIQSVQSVVSRRVAPQQPVTVNLGRIEGGSAYNILADEVNLWGTARYLDTELIRSLPAMLEEAAGCAAASCGCTCTLAFEKRIPPVVNDPRCSMLAQSALKHMRGQTQHAAMPQTMISEDFSLFLLQTPGCFGFLGAHKQGTSRYPHHHPKFTIEESVLSEGAALMASYVWEAQAAL